MATFSPAILLLATIFLEALIDANGIDPIVLS
jgi:hypothetical protein